MLKLYVSPLWRRHHEPEPYIHTPLLNPWWGNPNPDASLFAKEMFDAHPFDTSLYRVTDDISQADMVLPPYKHQWFLRHDMHLWDECVKTAKDANLPLLIDGVGDVDYPIDVPNAYILRIGGYRFLPERGRIQIPPPSDDLFERVCNGTLEIRKKQEGIATVGFAGWAQLTPVQRARNFLKEFSIRVWGIFDSRYRAMQKGVLWRARALDILRRSSKVKLNVKARPSFSGSAKTAEKDLRTLRKELVDTVLQSDYALDVRGDANDSTRLFEICSLGRIPVTVDTERNFPFSDVINYKDFCVIVDFRELKKLPDIISDFHKNVTPEKYEDMQRKARETFVNYFRIDAHMKQIVRLLEKMI